MMQAFLMQAAPVLAMFGLVIGGTVIALFRLRYLMKRDQKNARPAQTSSG